MHSKIAVTDCTIRALDGRPLAATWSRPPVAPHGAPCVVIGSATATRRQYYQAFAEHLAELGFDVVTFDNRGTGGSRIGALRNDEATMADYGEQDLPAVLSWVLARKPSRLLYVGHSVGGQVFPLAANAAEVDAALLVAAPSGWRGHWSGVDRLRSELFFRVLAPSALALTGALPGFLLGQPLPPGVVRQWSAWCADPAYLRTPAVAERFAAIRIPMRAIHVEADPFGPAAATTELASWYSGAAMDHVHLPAEGLAGEKLGHFGFFRARSRDGLWPHATDWLVRQAAGPRRADRDGRPHVAAESDPTPTPGEGIDLR